MANKQRCCWGGRQITELLEKFKPEFHDSEASGGMMTSSNENIFRVNQLTLLAICAGNSPVTGESSHKHQWRGDLMFSLICAWINGWVNNGEAGDLRRHCAYYDITVMYCGKTSIKMVKDLTDDNLVNKNIYFSVKHCWSCFFIWLASWFSTRQYVNLTTGQFFHAHIFASLCLA